MNDDYLKVAKECGIEFDVVDVTAGGRKEAFVSEQQLEAYTSRILASQQAAHDAEIAKLKEEVATAKWHEKQTVALADKFYTQLSTANERIAYLEGLVAQQAEALKDLHYALYGNGTGSQKIEAAITASAETVQAFRDKLTEPLRREVAMLHKDATRWKKIVALASHFPAPMETASQQQGRGLFVMYEGSGVRPWLLNLQDEGLSHFVDNQAIAVEDNTQATAQAHEQKMKREGAIEALEDVVAIRSAFEERFSGNPPKFDGRDYLNQYYNDQWHLIVSVLKRMAAIIRATSKKEG